MLQSKKQDLTLLLVVFAALTYLDQAIKDGFAHLKPSTQYDALYEAALCRERADGIVGMNATRLFSCLYRQTLNIGRVLTPTLAMVVMRDAEYAEVLATKKKAYAKYRQEKTEAQELLIAQRNINSQPPSQPRVD